jgi:hypothetical protein
MSDTQTRLMTTLQPVVAALEADGYALRVEGDDDAGPLRVHIAATENACEECLAPKTVIQPMVEHLLEADGFGTDGLVLTYPNE